MVGADIRGAAVLQRLPLRLQGLVASWFLAGRSIWFTSCHGTIELRV